MKTTYSDTCTVHCTDHDRSVDAEILQFAPEKKLSVSLDRSVKVTLIYEPKHQIYVGSMGGLEFTSSGPQSYTVQDGRGI